MISFFLFLFIFVIKDLNMRSLNAVLILVLSSVNLFGQSKAKIGMTMEDMQKLYPKTESASYQNTITLSFIDTLYGIPGEWGYRFENNKLNWIHFDKYIDEINQANFDLCLKATRQIIKDYSKAYNSPDTLITGTTSFVDPIKKHHYGYDVMEARWNNYNGMKVKVEFTFFGGKGEYNFIVIINYFDKDYPYFD